MDTTQLNLIAQKRAKQCFAIAERKLNIRLPFHGIKFFEKSSFAGYVIPARDNVVHLNLGLFKKNVEFFERDTIPHEIAHLFADAINKRRRRNEGHHGKTWKAVMTNVFGLEPKRCHDLDVTGVAKKTKKFKYICKCQKHIVSTRTHNKIQSKESTYRCRNCLSSLTFLCNMQ
jgi:SprT protein